MLQSAREVEAGLYEKNVPLLMCLRNVYKTCLMAHMSHRAPVMKEGKDSRTHACRV